MSRVAAVLALCFLPVAGCVADGQEDPAVAAPGAGIPMGAIGATGVSFDPPSTQGDAPVPKGKLKPRERKPAPPAPPAPPPSAPDPFAEPPAPEAPAPKGAPRHPHASPKETTL